MLRITSKVLLTILTLIFWLAAAGLIFIGATVFHEYRNYEQLVKAYYTLIPASILIAVGIIFFILGLIGCVGAFKEQRCLLAVFFTVLLVLMMGMVVAASLGFFYHSDIETAVEDGLKKGLNDYYNNLVLKSEVDFMQSEIKCCGVMNYTDWQDTEWYKHQKNHSLPYPDSCCADKNCTTSTNFYSRGCYTFVKNEFLSHLGMIAGVAGAFVILLVFGMIAACALICHRRSQNTYIGLTSPEHMRV